MENPTFLIIDDDGVYRNFVIRCLKALGPKEVFQAENGEAGFFLAEKKQPDLVILDMRMPAVTGLTVIRRLKECAATAHIPVLIATGEPRFTVICDQEHAAGILFKPFTQRQLLEVIRGLLPALKGAQAELALA